MLRGPEAFELGIADAMFEPADFLEESLRWASAVADGSVTEVPRPVGPDWRSAAGTEEEWAAAVAAARFLTDGKLHGAAPAPYRALDLVAAARTAYPRRGVRRRGRGPRRPAAVGRAARRALRVRPGAEAGPQARRARLIARSRARSPRSASSARA